MAEKEDNLGLMPSLQMTPAGYIPPQAAVIGSGLAGISAQQTALQRQLNQEAEQRRKEAEQEMQNIGKTQYTLGAETYNPEMMAQGAGLMALGSRQFQAPQFAPQATMKRLESLKSILESEVVPQTTKQAVYNAAFPQGLAGAYMMPAVAPQVAQPPMPAAGAMPAPETPAAAPQAAPPPPPATDTLVAPVSKTVKAAIEPLLNRIAAASNSLATTFRSLGLSADQLPTAQQALGQLMARARGAKTLEDLAAIDNEVANIQAGITYQTPTQRAKSEEEFVAAGSVWRRKNVTENGRTVSKLERVGEVPLSAAQKASLALRKQSLAISAGHLGVARATLERLDNKQQLELETLLTTSIDDNKLQADAYKDATSRVEPKYAARLKSPYSSERATAQAEFDAEVKATAQQLYDAAREREERKFANTPAGKARLRQILSKGAAAPAAKPQGAPRVVNIIDALKGPKVRR